VNTYRIEVMVPSWSQYLLQGTRLTKVEKIILDRVGSFHVGSSALGEQMFLCVNKELQSKHHGATKDAGAPAISA
jgi:hypothetical protein